MLCRINALKVGVEEWLNMIVESLYKNARNQVTVNGSFSYDFLVQIGSCQGSVFSPLYPYDLVLVDKTLEDLKGKLKA